jgi:acetyl/propionyl-CoA carboxylase alpha subunit
MPKLFEFQHAPDLAAWQEAWSSIDEKNASLEEWDMTPHPKKPGQGWLRNIRNGLSFRYALTQENGNIRLWLNGLELSLSQALPRHQSQTGAFRETLQAPMPGKIIRISASAGDKLAAKHTVIVMESMKMELSLTTETPCQVSDITVAEGDLVEMNATLARFEPLPPEH